MNEKQIDGIVIDGVNNEFKVDGYIFKYIKL